jgi:hypothetical protein
LKRFLILVALAALLLPQATAKLLTSGRGAQGPMAPASIASVGMSCGSSCGYTSGAASGTAVGTINVTLSAGPFTGTLSESGAAAADFTISGTTLQTNGSTPTCSSSTPLSLNIIATQGGLANSPYTQPITVTCSSAGGGVACDTGPNVASVPAPATAAGFTHCALNYDFSQAFYAVQSNYLDCGNNDPTKPWHWGGPFGTALQGPCASVFQTTDPVTGETVLDIRWLNSYPVASPNLVMYNALSASSYTDYPNFYAETVMRVDNLVAGGTPSAMAAFWDGQDAAGSFYGNDIEKDYVEENTGAFGVTDQNILLHGNGSGGGQNWSDGAAGDLTAYHKFGFLWTSDGATANYGCGWIDDVFKGCKSVTGVTTGVGQYLTRNFMILDNSCYGGTGSCVAGNQATSAPTTNTYFKYARVWSCASWALAVGATPTPATMCNGSTLFNSGGLTYWH